MLVLVREMAMSQSVFYRRLKGLTSQTTVEFIRDVRLRRAAQQLASSQLLVSEVAYEMGIEDTRYFSCVFQKLFGQAPSDYARQHRPYRRGQSEGVMAAAPTLPRDYQAQGGPLMPTC